MLLTISTTHKPATDLGWLLHKRPGRFQSFEFSHGNAHVFYPQVSEGRCSACLLIDVDPVALARGKNRNQAFLLGQYVNDRPYVASSFMSVAISKVFRSAMNGRCKERSDLVDAPLPLEARIEVIPVRGGEDFLRRIFEPLGYQVTAKRQVLDSEFSDWGESSCYTVTISGTARLSKLLTHLYVLIPVFDNGKHYYVDHEELEKLLAKGEDWLAAHSEKEQITRRYLRHQSSLFRQALARLVEIEESPEEAEEDVMDRQTEDKLENSLSLNDQRHGTALAALKANGARSVIDLGCGEGKLLRELMKQRQFEKIVGVDVSIRSLEIAHRRLKIERLPTRQAERLKLIHGSLIYRDERLAGFDAAALVEVIEHLDPPRLAALERVLFEFAQPQSIVVTTPNIEYNVMWESLPAGKFRHSDHRFEWTREEFRAWTNRIAEQYGYTVRHLPIGPEDATVGAPTQMAVFDRANASDTRQP